MKSRSSDIYLSLIAGIIALGILAFSIHTLWEDHRQTWQEAEQSSRNLLMALSRDLSSQIKLLDQILVCVIEDLGDDNLNGLAPELRHRMLFNRAVAAKFMGSILVLDETGEVIADASSVSPRAGNFSDRDYFTAHKERADIGLYVSVPYKSRFRNSDPSIAISRRIDRPDGSFGGVVMGAISLAKIHDLFKDLNLGWEGSITLFRNDGIVLVRKPYDEAEVGRDMRSSPNTQRFVGEMSGTFASESRVDGVHRLYTFAHINDLPFILSVSAATEEVFSAWRRKAIAQGTVTALLCFAIVALSFLFQRELKRRTQAETKLRRIARTDDLTSLPNRRAFRETFEQEWRHAIRSGTPISLLFADADFFKAYNDHYGHGAGDELICAIARTLNARIRRPRDTAARYGGEEFTIVLPDTDQDGALVVAEKIRQAVMAMDVAHERSPYRTVTVSIGVATARPSLGSSGANLLEAADTALYQAKASGRNCICSSEPEPAPTEPSKANAVA